MICHKSPNKIKKLENGLFKFFKDFPHKLAIRFLQCYYKILAYNTTRKIKAKKPSLHSARPLPPKQLLHTIWTPNSPRGIFYPNIFTQHTSPKGISSYNKL